MPSNQPCEPGCACGRHNRAVYGGKPVATPEEKREYARRYRAEHREILATQQRERYVARGDAAREPKRRYRQANREKIREQGRLKAPEYRLRNSYRMSLEQWAQMLDAQEGLCYLCAEPLDLQDKRKIHVDHDHACCRGSRSCGTCVRGLACNDCNLGIGRFRDDPERMRRVADNLEMATARLRDPARMGSMASSNALAGEVGK